MQADTETSRSRSFCLSFLCISTHHRISYIGVGNQVLGYDLRKASSPIVKAVDDDLTEIIDTEEEISQISFATRGSTSMAVADDGGKVFVTNPLSPPLPKKKKKRRRWVLQHDEDCLAMVTSCVFRPRGGDVLASGGTDCMVRLWDVSKPRQPIASHHVTREDTGVNQICNPPMVHSMAWSPSGRLLAAGLGDGTIEVVRFLPQDKQSLVRVARLRDGHDATVASVVFPEFVSPSSSNHVAAHDRLLVSAGTDGAIFLWDLGKRVCGNGALHPSNDVLAGSNSALETEMNNMSLANNGDDPNLLFGIPHQHKPNWMVSTRGADTVFPSTLFVADTSNDITGYSIPLQS